MLLSSNLKQWFTGNGTSNVVFTLSHCRLGLTAMVVNSDSNNTNFSNNNVTNSSTSAVSAALGH